MLLLGRGVKALTPERRLLVDAFALLLTLAVLLGMTVALDFDRSFAVVYISVFMGVQVLMTLVRFVRARGR
jgi:hypothetical protein